MFSKYLVQKYYEYLRSNTFILPNLDKAVYSSLVFWSFQTLHSCFNNINRCISKYRNSSSNSTKKTSDLIRKNNTKKISFKSKRLIVYSLMSNTYFSIFKEKISVIIVNRSDFSLFFKQYIKFHLNI